MCCEPESVLWWWWAGYAAWRMLRATFRPEEISYNFRCLKLRSSIYVHHHSHWRNNSAEQFFMCSSMVIIRTWRITSFANQAINPFCWGTNHRVTIWLWKKGSAECKGLHTQLSLHPPGSVWSTPLECLRLPGNSVRAIHILPHKPFPPGHTRISGSCTTKA